MDPSAKRVRFIAVPAGRGTTVRLETIDWGGHGSAVLLLAGLGESGHIYNDLAPRLTDRFRVVALTRRGHGASTGAGSSTSVLDTLVADIRAVMDSFQLRRASLIGHSIAGAQITRFAARWPERTDKLIYLGASHDFAGIDSILSANPAWPPRFSPLPGTATDTLNATRERFKRYRFGYWSDALESGILRTPDPDEPAMNVLLHDATVHPKEYRAVRAPALAFTPRYTIQNWFFYLDPVTDSVKWKGAEHWLTKIVQPWLDAGHARFRREVPTSPTIEFEGDHHFFNSQPERTLREVRKFLLSRNDIGRTAASNQGFPTRRSILGTRRGPKESPKQKKAPAFAGAFALLGSSRRRPYGVSRKPPKVNQDSPDPEGPIEPGKFRHFASDYASSCNPMLEFAGLHAELCCTLLAQMSEFAGVSALLSLHAPRWDSAASVVPVAV